MKINDPVICIDTDFIIVNKSLTLNKTYTILSIPDSTDRILIINNLGKQEWYYKHRFISLKQQRKDKLLQLKTCPQ